MVASVVAVVVLTGVAMAENEDAVWMVNNMRMQKRSRRQLRSDGRSMLSQPLMPMLMM